MMMLHGIECMTKEDLLPKNKEGGLPETGDTAVNLEAERSGEGKVEEVSKDNFNWKWSKGMKPSGRPIKDVLDDARKEFLAKEGRLYTTEEVVQLVDDIRKELHEKSSGVMSSEK